MNDGASAGDQLRILQRYVLQHSLDGRKRAAKEHTAWLEFKKNHPFDENTKTTGISGKAIPYIYSMGGFSW